MLRYFTTAVGVDFHPTTYY